MCSLKEQEKEIFLNDIFKDYTNNRRVKKIKAVKPFHTSMSF